MTDTVQEQETPAAAPHVSPSKEVRSSTPALSSPKETTIDESSAPAQAASVSKTGRVRKTVEVYKEVVKEKAAFEIVVGKGVEIGSIEEAMVGFDKLKSDHDICKAVHTVLFNRAGKKTEIKKNVRKWSGVTTEDEDELEEIKEKMATKLFKQSASFIKDAMDCFAVDRSSKTGEVDKESLTWRFVDWLICPTEPVSKKRKSVSVKKAAPKKKKSKKSTTKVKVVEEEEGGEEEEEESEEEEEEEEEEEDDDDVDDDDDNDAYGDSPKKKAKKPKAPKPISTGAIKKWVKAYIKEIDTATLTVNQTVTACGENFGVDMSERKKEIKSILLKAMDLA
ncbi:hypothetical protein TrLO_g5927 [Triparma laevis f. longispina]|uniref:DEK-C domain-containing protein n=1 Tax=Triparma laevis f. longispina TaxID=1714387 RepID=A0A9W6ZUD6_9STRA|nr:hypothetical protein TrLO_g5927 [Triparma laevis f. longispina]